MFNILFIFSLKENNLKNNWISAGVGNSLWLAGHIGNKIAYAGQYKYHNDLFDLTFERKGAFSGPFKKRTILRGIFNVLST